MPRIKDITLSQFHAQILSSENIEVVAQSFMIRATMVEKYLAQLKFKNEILSFDQWKALSIADAESYYGKQYHQPLGILTVNLKEYTLADVHQKIVHCTTLRAASEILHVSGRILKLYLSNFWPNNKGPLTFAALRQLSIEEAAEIFGELYYKPNLPTRFDLRRGSLINLYEDIKNCKTLFKAANHLGIYYERLSTHLATYTYKGKPLIFSVLKALSLEEVKEIAEPQASSISNKYKGLNFLTLKELHQDILNTSLSFDLFVRLSVKEEQLNQHLAQFRYRGKILQYQHLKSISIEDASIEFGDSYEQPLTLSSIPLKKRSLAEIHECIRASSSLNNAAIALQTRDVTLSLYLEKVIYDGVSLTYEKLLNWLPEEAQKALGEIYNMPISLAQPEKKQKKYRFIHGRTLADVHKEIQSYTTIKNASKLLDIRRDTLRRYLGKFSNNEKPLTFEDLIKLTVEEAEKTFGELYYQPNIPNRLKQKQWSLIELYKHVKDSGNLTKAAIYLGINEGTLVKFIARWAYKGKPLTFSVLKGLNIEALKDIIESNGLLCTEDEQNSLSLDKDNLSNNTLNNNNISNNNNSFSLQSQREDFLDCLNVVDNNTPVLPTLENVHPPLEKVHQDILSTSSSLELLSWLRESEEELTMSLAQWGYDGKILNDEPLASITVEDTRSAFGDAYEQPLTLSSIFLDNDNLSNNNNSFSLQSQREDFLDCLNVLDNNTPVLPTLENVHPTLEGKAYYKPNKEGKRLNELSFAYIHEQVRNAHYETLAAKSLGVGQLTLKRYLNRILFKGYPLTFSRLHDLSVEEGERVWGDAYQKPVVPESLEVNNSPLSIIHARIIASQNIEEVLNSLENIRKDALLRYLYHVMEEPLTFEDLKKLSVIDAQERFGEAYYLPPTKKLQPKLFTSSFANIHEQIYSAETLKTAAINLGTTETTLKQFLAERMYEDEPLTFERLKQSSPGTILPVIVTAATTASKRKYAEIEKFPDNESETYHDNSANGQNLIDMVDESQPSHKKIRSERDFPCHNRYAFFPMNETNETNEINQINQTNLSEDFSTENLFNCDIEFDVIEFPPINEFPGLLLLNNNNNNDFLCEKDPLKQENFLEQEIFLEDEEPYDMGELFRMN